MHLRQQTFRPELSTLNPDTHGCALGCRARSERRSFGNLHLLFRLVSDGLLFSKLQRARSPYLHHVPPTLRGDCRLHSTPSASFHQTPAALAPASAMLPQTPMHGAPSHNYIPALKPTTTALKSGLRRTASRGREIVVGALCHALAYKLPVAPLRCTTPRFAVHSFSPPFLWLQSPPLRTGSSSPPIADIIRPWQYDLSNPFD